MRRANDHFPINGVRPKPAGRWRRLPQLAACFAAFCAAGASGSCEGDGGKSDPKEARGACSDVEFSLCVDDLSDSACEKRGGDFAADKTCDDLGFNIGACYVSATDTCTDDSTEEDCDAAGGSYHGAATCADL